MEDTKTKVESESSVSPEHLAAAEQVLKALTKLVNGRKIYAANNPRLEQFRAEFDSALLRFFEMEDELVLTVDQYALRWNDHVVYENIKREESLAFILFKDGIGEVTILPHAVGKETAGLVEILTSEIHNDGSDEDVVTRFWNADFEHITYRVLDDYLSGEFGRGAADGGSDERQDETSDHPELLPSLNEKGRVFVDRSQTLRSVDEFLRGALTLHHPEGDDRQREALYQRLLRTVFAVPAEEIAIYTRELEEERLSDGVAAFAEAIIVFTLMPDNPSGVRDIMSILDRVLDYAVEEKNAETLTSLLTLTHEFLDRDDLADNVRIYCEKAVRRLSDPALLTILMEEIAGPSPATTATLAYATAIGRGAVEPVSRTLHRAEGTALHRQICDTLIAVAGDGAAAALDRFDIDNPQVAVDSVYIARKIGVPALTARLRELVFYPDPRVKLDMIEWLSSRRDGESTDLLMQSLADLDKRVRLRVLDALQERSDAPVREKIAELAFGKDFGDRASDEQEAIFRALGRVGDAHTVDQIRGLVEKRKLLNVGKGAESKLLAIRALERIKDHSALDVLTRLASDTNEAVKLRATRARDALAAALESKDTEKTE